MSWLASPAGPDFLAGGLVPGVLGALLAWLAAVAVGSAASAPLERASHGPRSFGTGRLLRWSVVGVAVLALLVLALPLIAPLTPVSVVTTAGAAALASAVVRRRAILQALRAARREVLLGLRGAARDPTALAAVVVLVAVLGIAARFAFVPSASYDDHVYHLGLPRQALLQGEWPLELRFHYSLMPAGWGAFQVLAASVGGGLAMQLASAVALGLLAVAVARLAARLAPWPAALAGTALALSSPVFASLGALAGNDLFVALALTVACEHLLATRGRAPLVTGLTAGAAWAAKLTALATAGGIAIAHAVLRGGDARRRWLAVAAAGIASLLLAAPWTVRAFTATGNPVHPAFFGVFGGAGWSSTAAALVARDASDLALPGRGAAAFPLSVVDLLARSDHLGWPAGLQDLLIPAALVGAVLVALPAARRRNGEAAPAGRNSGRATALLVVLVFAWIGWAATSLNLRYALVVACGAGAFAGVAFAAAARGGRLVRLALCALLLVAAARELRTVPQRLAVVHGATWDEVTAAPRATVLERRSSLATAGRALAATLPEDARILAVAEARLAFLPRPALASSAYDEPLIGDLLRDARSPADATRSALDAGATHVLLHRDELRAWAESYRLRERLPPGADELLEPWLRTLEPVGRWGPVLVWALPARHAGAVPETEASP